MGLKRPAQFLRAATILWSAWLAPVLADPITVFTAELPPFVRLENGEITGSHFEILQEMARRADIDLDIKVMPWKRSQIAAKNTPNSLIMSLGRSASREAHYGWVAKIYVTNEVFVSIGEPVDSLVEAGRLARVTALAGSPRARKLEEAGLSNVHVSRNTEIAAGLLTMGRANAWYTLDHRALYAFETLGISTDDVVLGKALHSIDVWIASNVIFDPKVSAALAGALDDMRADGTLDAIVLKYSP